MVLREFRSGLLGANINMYTDHKHLTYASFNTQRVLRQRLYVEEHAPKLFYLQGKLNVLVDTFSPYLDLTLLRSWRGRAWAPRSNLFKTPLALWIFIQLLKKRKADCRGFGHLPARDVKTAPWEQVDTDLIGH